MFAYTRAFIAKASLSGLVLAFCASAARAAVATAVEVGNPTWEPTGFVLFSAPIGTPADGYAEFTQTQQNILPEPYWQTNPNNGDIVPDASNPGPYASEVQTGVAANGYTLGPNFSPTDFSGGNAVWLGFVLVPTANAPTGSSPDFSSGPIISDSITPFTQTGDTQRDGVDFDPNWAGPLFPDVNSEMAGLGRPSYDGYSHTDIFEAETYEFGPGTGPDGDYSSSWTILDANGNGWTVSTSYTVSVPEPASASLLAVGSLALLRRFRIKLVPNP